MRIAVIGAGGVGGYFGGRLAVGGQDVTFVARGAHLEAIQRDGLTVASVAGDFRVSPARATHDTAEVGAVDLVMVCVKTWQLAPAIDGLPPLMGPDTAVLTVQNGVEAPGLVAEAVGQESVLPGSAKVFASIERPGVVRHAGGPGSLAFAEWDNRASPRVETLRAALVEAGASVVVPDDAVGLLPMAGSLA
jgi:2-dehydropantoate 2-reductase